MGNLSFAQHDIMSIKSNEPLRYDLMMAHVDPSQSTASPVLCPLLLSVQVGHYCLGGRDNFRHYMEVHAFFFPQSLLTCLERGGG